MRFFEWGFHGKFSALSLILGVSISATALGNDFAHTGEPQTPENTEHLKWLHISIPNAKVFILGTYHGLDSLHLQTYLNEFCYRFNHRKFTLQYFARTLTACLCGSKLTYHELTR